MSQLTPDLAAELIAACRRGDGKLAEAFGQLLERQFSVTVGEASAYNVGALSGAEGGGLAVLMNCGPVGLAAVLPEASGLLPEWCASPDAAATRRLQTLAQELTAIVAPAGLIVESFAAGWVSDIREALSRAGAASDATLVPMELSSGDLRAQLSLIWPLESPSALFSPSATAEGSLSTSNSADPFGGEFQEPDFSRLPHYSRSLLKIRVPISVELATRKESVEDVIGLAAGSIIKFDKNCDELLQMIVGGQAVAEGEAVKIGDKFGFRVTSMLLPREHFLPVKRPADSTATHQRRS